MIGRVSDEATTQFAKHRIDAAALLGLRDPVEGSNWGPIRAAQIDAARRTALLFLAAHLIGASLTVLIAMKLLAPWLAACWGGALAAMAVGITFKRLSPQWQGAAMVPVMVVRRTSVSGIAMGMIWTVPPLALAPSAGPVELLELWVVLSMLMTASALATAALPLATLSFLAILGAALAAMMFVVSGPVLAAATALFTLALMVTCYAQARGLVVMRANEMALAERDETVNLLLGTQEEQGADWLWEIDAARRIVRASPRFAYVVGEDPLSINHKPILQVLGGSDWDNGPIDDSLRDLAEKLKRREAFHDLLLPIRIKNEQRWLEISAAPRFDEAGAYIGFRGVGSDVTEARAAAEKINHMARFDTLTGLPNRLMIYESLSKALADGEKWSTRCAFMMIDLDRFKSVNDSLGHPVGDRLLGRVAQRLGQLMSPNELVGRLGGDEFAIVARDASDTQRVDLLARRAIEAISAPYEIDQNTLHIGASIGIAYGPRDGRTAETLIRSSDLALYRSKDAGGGVFHAYEPQLHAQAEERRVLEMALRKALANDELSLNYQPVVAAKAGALVGFEALLRWTHPTLGEISPAKFIPLAEETRLIAPIGEWVLRTACHEAARWADPVRVAVNVSPEQLLNPAFVTIVASTLASSGLSPDRLELEVTESVFMREGTCATQVLERILDLGVRLSLDDFGTGYSSLGYLSRTRFSTIKIDRSFVRGASKNKPEAIAIIRAVVALAHSLNMATTAEGVETEAEHRLITELGCTKVQGYYFGRPLPEAEARALAARAAAIAA